MVRRSGQQGVPVIAVDDQYIVGFDQPRLESALAGAARSRPAFGASVADVSSTSVRRAGLPESGAYVGRVRSDSPAERIGLAAGDVIVSLGGHAVRTAAELESALRALTAGTRVSVEYVRRG
ncbi:MAG TPA: PDZ domain-containing protein, partial [Dehalococcoidia bacterium]|nr:PDZ domain-containing protein [Dehalococcoidia bacterium]